MGIIMRCDYVFNSEIIQSRGIWMSFFSTEEAHTVMIAKGADRGGRVAPQVISSSAHLAICSEHSRPPGSSVKSRLNAPAQFGAKKDIHIPHYSTELRE
jgi:hypothetical protein